MHETQCIKAWQRLRKIDAKNMKRLTNLPSPSDESKKKKFGWRRKRIKIKKNLLYL